MGTEEKQWSDQTAGKSYIEHLTFPADRKWTKVKVEMYVKAGFGSANVKTELHTDKIEGSGSVQEKWGSEETKSYEVNLNRVCAFYIDGYLSGVASKGRVTVTASYEDGSILKSESKTWGDETAGISMIDRLYLDATQKWEKVTIAVSFDKNKSTGCMVTLLNNGELAYMNDGNIPPWADHFGSGNKIYEFTLNGRDKVPLVVDGYITSHAVIGGGATITLTGYYRG
jgi:hypothetical protein